MFEDIPTFGILHLYSICQMFKLMLELLEEIILIFEYF